jgi:FkbM family methyltransferase
MTTKLFKAVAILIRPPLWVPLLRGTAAGVEHIRALRSLKMGTCLDVGANAGQFSVLVRHMFPQADIIAFEPLAEAADCFALIMKGKNATLHRTALGATNGECILHVTDRADSSSLLSPGEGEARAFGVREARAERVSVARLSDLVRVAECKRPIFMKIDVQGGELDVLKGCGDALSAIDWVYVEVSYVTLYSGQPLASDIVRFLIERGFKLRGVFNQAETRAYGATQADFLFSNQVGAEI